MRRPRSPAGQARGRARWRARNQSAVHSPSPRTAASRALHLVVGQRGERVEVEVGAREADDVLGLAAREAERDELVLGGRARARSRVGNAYACSTRPPKRSISRLRIANAARSETCCAVIEVDERSRTGRARAAAGSRRALGDEPSQDRLGRRAHA